MDSDYGESIRLTKRKTRRLTRRLIAGWRKGFQLELGFTVCCHSFNMIYTPVLFYSVIGAGGRFTGTNPAYTVSEIAHHLRATQTDYIVTTASEFERVSAAAAECSLPQTRIITIGIPISSENPSWKLLLEFGELDWISSDDEELSRDTTVALFSTSGTTGLPKMAVRTHRNLVAECVALNDLDRKPYPVSSLR